MNIYCEDHNCLSVSPSPQMQTSQWESSIICTGRNSDIFRFQHHRETLEDEAHIGFMGFMVQKCKMYVPGVLGNTDSRYPERMAI